MPTGTSAHKRYVTLQLDAAADILSRENSGVPVACRILRVFNVIKENNKENSEKKNKCNDNKNKLNINIFFSLSIKLFSVFKFRFILIYFYFRFDLCYVLICFYFCFDLCYVLVIYISTSRVYILLFY